MRIYHSIEEFSAKNPIVTIGMFDGVHAGHRTILRQMNDIKREYGGETVLLTFWPHPRMYFGKTDGFSLLTTIDEKMELLEQAGLDVCVILPFSSDFANLSPEDYISSILYKGIGAKKVVIGYDHRYGKNGAGTFDLMQDFGKKLGFEVEQISAYSVDLMAVSSTKIRNCLLQGNIETANSYLSYEYFLNGIVVAGHQFGRTIGFPTANLQLNTEYKVIPANGVYAAFAEIENQCYKAVVNIGTNPTVRQTTCRTIEAYLLGIQKDLYNKNVRVRFVSRIRDEHQFETIQDLQTAISTDVETAKKILG